MKPGFFRSVIYRFVSIFGIHPEVGDLISASFRLSNPSSAAFPTENIPFASHVIASGIWNYCFFQFYRHFAGPYWVERQYNPEDPSFIPRASSPLNINLTHRTWMGFRGRGSDNFALIDPAGAVSPIVGYYSIEIAVREDGKLKLPTRGDLQIVQFPLENTPVPRTIFETDDTRIQMTCAGAPPDDPDLILASIQYEVNTEKPVDLIIGIRPFNPEGAAPIQKLHYHEEAGNTAIIDINDIPEILILRRPDETRFSDLATGDAYFTENNTTSSECSYGIATGALEYKISGRGEICYAARTYDRKTRWTKSRRKSRRKNSGIRSSRLFHRQKSRNTIEIDDRIYIEALQFDKKQTRQLKEELTEEDLFRLINRNHLQGSSGAESLPPTTSIIQEEINRSVVSWKEVSSGTARFQCAKPLWNQTAEIMTRYVRSLQTGDSITPGVYTYRQFWFRDAAYMLHALIRWNMFEESARVIRTFRRHQDSSGFFRSHEGEWDSNGQAIWTILDYVEHSGDTEIIKELYPSLLRGARWIERKRKNGYKKKIMPAGFSAEHLGPADHYYWDNLWSIAGLNRAAKAAAIMKDESSVKKLLTEESAYKRDLLEVSENQRKKYNLLTAGPGRPLDPGMIGSIAALYPLHIDDLFPGRQIENTVMTIYNRFFHKQLFFHPIIHSGYNIYLTVQMAHSLFLLGEIRSCRKILKRVLSVRSSLWTYPEAIHPGTGGGVMGDGFHGWAFAEILNLLRELVVSREDKTLHIFKGMRKKELMDSPLLFGPFPLSGTTVSVEGEMNSSEGEIKIRIPHISRTTIEQFKLYVPAPLKKKTLKIESTGGEIGLEEGVIIINNPGEEIQIRFNAK